MSPQEFGMQLDRLKTLYSEKNFPEERVKVMWARYSGFPAKAFSLAVDWVVLSMPSPGGVISVLDEKLAYAKRDVSAESRPEPKYDCAACRDFGYTWSKENEHLIVHCTCAKHESISFKELERQQRNYDTGRKLLRRRSDLAGFVGGA